MANYELDPKGDAIIHLKTGNASFAPWNGADASAAPRSAKRVKRAPACTYRVSSRHLILASKVFESAFCGGFSEQERQSDGCLHMEAEEWDAEAFELVLNIVHGRNRKVPRQLSLEMLAKVAVVVDYYKLQEAVEVHSSMWIEGLKDDLPMEYCRDLVLWICISSVFAEREVLHDAASTAVCTCRSGFQTLGLPIPVELADKLNDLRNQALEAALLRLRKLRDDLICGRLNCTRPCQAQRLGTLQMRLHEHVGGIVLDSSEPSLNYSLNGFSGILIKLHQKPIALGSKVGACCELTRDVEPILTELDTHMRDCCFPNTISWGEGVRPSG